MTEQRGAPLPGGQLFTPVPRELITRTGTQTNQSPPSSSRLLLPLTVKVPCEADVQALGGADAAAVEAAEMPKSARSGVPECHG
jgi:hypothetical protein